MVPSKQKVYVEALGKERGASRPCFLVQEWPERQCLLDEALQNQLQQLVVNAPWRFQGTYIYRV